LWIREREKSASCATAEIEKMMPMQGRHTNIFQRTLNLMESLQSIINRLNLAPYDHPEAIQHRELEGTSRRKDASTTR
jgi:hypothetical protein